MGGDGTKSPAALSRRPQMPPIELVPQPPDPLETGYVVINRHTDRGGKMYPFLEQLGYEWSIVIHNVDEAVTVDPQYTLDMQEATLSWVSGESVIDVYIDGLSQDQFQQLTGLEFDTNKGGFVLSKRVSRAMREYYLCGQFPSWNLDITIMSNQSSDQKLIWDGAGVVSRSLLKRMPLPPDLDPVRRAELLYQRDHTNRVEFTIMTGQGQYKGHAIVSDSIEEDFILPDDCKDQVRLKGDNTWIGFDFVHGHSDMRIDIQSMVDLQPFLDSQDYETWLEDEYELFEDKVRAGELLDAIRRIQPDTTLSDLEHWPLAEYAVSGGQAEWSVTQINSLFNQMIKRVRTRDEKLRIPIPGGRMYVMSESVGKAAGLDIHVPRGQTCIDPQYQTVWVNDQDWLSLGNNRSHADGIRDILGGADQDDGIWCFPFLDKADGIEKVLMWRSPNQPGEYVILRPNASSAALTWETPEGTPVAYPEADSSRLPTRKDRQTTKYLGLVDPDSGIIGKGQDYQQAMAATRERAIANKGVLGKYCNFLLVCKAIGHVPSELPAPLEHVIDSSVKTGADLTAVSEWIDREIRSMKKRRIAIPEVLSDRFIVQPDPNKPHEYIPPSPSTSNNWLDRMMRICDEHTTRLSTLRDEVSAQARPPAGVMAMAFENPENLEIARKFNTSYHNTLLYHLTTNLADAEERALQAAQKRSGQDEPPRRLLQQLTDSYQEAARDAAYNTAAAAALRFLQNYPDEQQAQVLAASWASVHLPSKDKRQRSEGAAWIGGPDKTPGPAHILMEGMRQRGLLARFRQTDNRLETYALPDLSSAPFRRLEPVVIRDVWFEFEQHFAERVTQQGQAPYSQMPDVPKHEDRQLKARVARKANLDFRNLQLSIRTEHKQDGSQRQVAYTVDGKRFGIIDPHYSASVGDNLTLAFSNASDGSLYGLAEPQSQERDE